MDYKYKLKLLDDGPTPENWINKRTGAIVAITVNRYCNGALANVVLNSLSGRITTRKHCSFAKHYDPAGAVKQIKLDKTKKFLDARCFGTSPVLIDDCSLVYCIACGAEDWTTDGIRHKKGCELVAVFKEIAKATGEDKEKK